MCLPELYESFLCVNALSGKVAMHKAQAGQLVKKNVATVFCTDKLWCKRCYQVSTTTQVTNESGLNMSHTLTH